MTRTLMTLILTVLAAQAAWAQDEDKPTLASAPTAVAPAKPETLPEKAPAAPVASTAAVPSEPAASGVPCASCTKPACTPCAKPACGACARHCDWHQICAFLTHRSVTGSCGCCNCCQRQPSVYEYMTCAPCKEGPLPPAAPGCKSCAPVTPCTSCGENKILGRLRSGCSGYSGCGVLNCN